MRSIETADVDGAVPLDVVRSVLDEHPVQFAILFGSHATGDIHSRSDVDIAVEFEGLRPADDEYNETFFGLGADLSEALGTDDVDLLDVHRLSAPLARSVFDEGVLLVGEHARITALRQQSIGDERDERSPRERFDDSLRRIDEHFA
jgi:predicted nucleotidyltransferase